MKTASLLIVAIAVGGCLRKSDEDLTLDEVFSDRDTRELVEAAVKGDAPTIKRLVDVKKVNVNTKGTNGITPLFFCYLHGDKKGFRALLKQSADPNVIINDGDSVMHNAAGNIDHEWLEIALKHGGDPNLVTVYRRSKRRCTPLYSTFFTGIENRSRHRNAELLVAAGANINYRSNYDELPISEAAITQHYEVVYVLLQHDADATARSGGRLSTLDYMHTHSDPKSLNKEQREWYEKCLKIVKEKGLWKEQPAEDPAENEAKQKLKPPGELEDNIKEFFKTK